MQKTNYHIAKQLHEKYPEYSEDLILKIDRFVFANLRQKIKEGKTLIYTLNPLGSFSFRKKVVEEYLRFGIDAITPQGRERAQKELDNLQALEDNLRNVLEQYKVYVDAKLKLKYEKFGKESHDAYLLAKKKKRLQKFQEKNRSKKHS